MTPKIHKQNNPGRPVISSVSSHTSEISRFVDHHLQANVKELKSYVKDTTDFINKIEAQPEVPEDSYLVSLDARSLYTNIPHKEGIEAVKNSLLEKPASVPLMVILTFLNLILTLNNFVFNSLNYLQIKGCAMGTKCAPCYANIFMGNFEEKYIYPLISKLSKSYLRYIDDIFLIWTGTMNEFEHFIENLNKCHSTIKFDYEISKNKVNFLDTTVYKDCNNKLRTKLYTKPTDRQNYLHVKSEHPPSIKNSIAYSQALRIRKICYEEEDLNQNCEQLAKTFKNRGYNLEKIKEQINRAKSTPRNELLKTKTKTPSKRIPLIVKYNRTLPPLRKFINEQWKILQIDKKIQDTFKERPIVAYKRNKNLKDYIGSNRIENNKKIPYKSTTNKIKRCEPCLGRSGNLCCKQIKSTNKFRSDITNKEYKIFHNSNCKSKNLIYLMECTL